MLSTNLHYFPTVKKALFILSAACLFLLILLAFAILIVEAGMIAGFVSPSCLSTTAFHAETIDIVTAVPDCWLIH